MEELKKDLTDLIDKLNNSVEKTTKELGKKSVTYMKKQYEEKLESDNSRATHLGEHIANINLHAYNKRYKKGFILSSGDDETVVYNEFGTGIVGLGTSKLAGDAGYEYNVPSPYKGEVPEGAVTEYAEEHGISKRQARAELRDITTANTWWYWKEGSWRHTTGMRGKNMYASLVEELKKVAKDDYEASIKATIGNYNSRRQ